MVANAIVSAESKPTVISNVTGIPRSIFTMKAEHLERMKVVAQMVSSSSLTYGRNLSEADAFLVMLKGAELGLEPMAALASIHIIQGLPTLSPQGMLALINRTGELCDLIIQGDATQCSVNMKRKGREPHIEVFTIKDAEAQKLTTKDNWKKQPATMLKWRAVAACARVVFPDIIQGLYTQEEIDTETIYTEDGAVGAAAQVDELSAVEPVDDPPGNGAVNYELEQVTMAVAFMYKNEHHITNSIPTLIDNGTIQPTDNTATAIGRILFHRARKDYKMTDTQVYEALSASVNEDPTITSYDQWNKLGRTVTQAWKAIQKYKQLMDSPPATSVNEDKTKSEVENPK